MQRENRRRRPCHADVWPLPRGETAVSADGLEDPCNAKSDMPWLRSWPARPVVCCARTGSGLTDDETGAQPSMACSSDGSRRPDGVSPWDEFMCVAVEPGTLTRHGTVEFVDETRSVIQEAQHPDGSGADLDEAECAWPMASSDGKTRAETADASKPRIYLDRPVWPLNKADEAGLFRHFVQELAIWVSTTLGEPPFPPSAAPDAMDGRVTGSGWPSWPGHSSISATRSVRSRPWCHGGRARARCC